jgi:hypothetical protein
VTEHAQHCSPADPAAASAAASRTVCRSHAAADHLTSG